MQNRQPLIKLTFFQLTIITNKFHHDDKIYFHMKEGIQISSDLVITSTLFLFQKRI